MTEGSVSLASATKEGGLFVKEVIPADSGGFWLTSVATEACLDMVFPEMETVSGGRAEVVPEKAGAPEVSGVVR